MAKNHKVPTTRQLQKKFADTAFRLAQERNDFFLPQIVDFFRKNQWLNLRPEYQRRLVWDLKKKSLFIESLLLNIPIPPIFLYESELSRYEVMDGQQRLNAVIEFYENGFALHGLDTWSDLNTRTYRQLPETLKRGLDRRRLSATVILFERTSEEQPEQSDIRKVVFERLNTGGQNLNHQEIRNAIFGRPVNDLLIRLSQNRLFTELWEIPDYEDHVDQAGRPDEKLADNPLYKRMVDCEIVLRFFAFRRRSRIKGSVRGILDTCMRDNDNASQQDIERMESEFLDRLAFAHKIFGARTFRYTEEGDGNWKLSRPLYDATMVALDRLYANRKKVITRKAAVARAVRRLFNNEDAYAVIVGRPNTAKAIHQRIDLLERTIKQAARL
jgi:hypothetical protein